MGTARRPESIAPDHAPAAGRPGVTRRIDGRQRPTVRYYPVRPRPEPARRPEPAFRLG